VVMETIKLGGFKLLQRGAQVAALLPTAEPCTVGAVCSPLAESKINLTLLTYVCLHEYKWRSAAFCTEGSAGAASASLLGEQFSRVALSEDVCTLSIFPHNNEPSITGTLLNTVTAQGIPVRGLASSPSAMSIIIPREHSELAIASLFRPFHFPSYRSPADWHAAYDGQQDRLEEIVARYQEQVIRIYGVVARRELDLWSAFVPAVEISSFATVLASLDGSRYRLPFVVALPISAEVLLSVCCFEGARSAEQQHIFLEEIPEGSWTHHGPVGGFSLHGPHFGDRHGIAKAVADVLEQAHIPILAMSCAVSTISAIVPEENLARALQLIERCFEKPSLPPRQKKT